jgi:hypothetical protein
LVTAPGIEAGVKAGAEAGARAGAKAWVNAGATWALSHSTARRIVERDDQGRITGIIEERVPD